MTHDYLIKKAIQWLKKKQRCSLVAKEFVTSNSIIPDAIGWRYGTSFLIEAKTSLSDLRRDRDKTYHRCPSIGMGEYRWYIVPEELKDKAIQILEQVPEDFVPFACSDEWGLLIVDSRGRVQEVKRSNRFDNAGKANEVVMLQSALRRLGVSKLTTDLNNYKVVPRTK